MAIICVICFYDFKKNDVLSVTKCGHLFHKECIKEWARRSPNCALCRSEKPDAFLVYLSMTDANTVENKIKSFEESKANKLSNLDKLKTVKSNTDGLAAAMKVRLESLKCSIEDLKISNVEKRDEIAKIDLETNLKPDVAKHIQTVCNLNAALNQELECNSHLMVELYQAESTLAIIKSGDGSFNHQPNVKEQNIMQRKLKDFTISPPDDVKFSNLNKKRCLSVEGFKHVHLQFSATFLINNLAEILGITVPYKVIEKIVVLDWSRKRKRIILIFYDVRIRNLFFESQEKLAANGTFSSLVFEEWHGEDAKCSLDNAKSLKVCDSEKFTERNKQVSEISNDLIKLAINQPNENIDVKNEKCDDSFYKIFV